MSNVIDFHPGERPCCTEASDMGVGSYERFSDVHIPRTQREAGIEHLEWMRSEPVRAWGKDAAAIAFLSIILAVCILVDMSIR